jgi:hypothetical protein
VTSAQDPHHRPAPAPATSQHFAPPSTSSAGRNDHRPASTKALGTTVRVPSLRSMTCGRLRPSGRAGRAQPAGPAGLAGVIRSRSPRPGRRRRPAEVTPRGLSNERPCLTFGGGGDCRYPGRTRWRRRVKPARPCIWRAIRLVLVMTPSVGPLLYGSVKAAITASRSRPGHRLRDLQEMSTNVGKTQSRGCPASRTSRSTLWVSWRRCRSAWASPWRRHRPRRPVDTSGRHRARLRGTDRGQTDPDRVEGPRRLNGRGHGRLLCRPRGGRLGRATA